MITGKMLEQLRFAAQLCPAPFYALDLEQRCIVVNEICVKAIGAPNSDAILGKTVEFYDDKEVIDNLTEGINFVLETGQVLQSEDKIIDMTTRKYRYYAATKSPLHNEKGEIVGVVGTSIEITSEKEAELLRLANQQITFMEHEKFRKKVEQVIHDIKTPIAMLNMTAELSEDMPSAERGVIRDITTSITSIVADLLSQYEPESKALMTSKPHVTLVAIFLSDIISSNRRKYPNIKFNYVINEVNAFLCIKIKHSNFEQMLNSIINNRINVLKGKHNAEIDVQVKAVENNVVIEIKDNGKSIAKDIIDEFYLDAPLADDKKQVASLKVARDAIKEADGKCDIQVAENKSTTFIISLPKVNTPHYVATEFKINPNDIVVILDDDKSAHTTWNFKLTPLLKNQETQIKYFTYGKEVVEFINNLDLLEKSRVLLLADYELLKQDINGIDVIEQTNTTRALLVTSYYNNYDIIQEVLKNQVLVLPKPLCCAIKVKI